MALSGDTKAVLLAAALMFLLALLLGAWKYREIATAPDACAHRYVDIAHRAALLYSFPLLLVATFAELSGWGTAVDLVAAGTMALYFSPAVVGYVFHGWRRDTGNQFRDPAPATHPFMVSLIFTEIGGSIVLVAGFLDGQIFQAGRAQEAGSVVARVGRIAVGRQPV